MSSFEILNLSKQLKNAMGDIGFESPTPIQAEAFSVILSGKDTVGIAQTGTGKTFAYLLPILQNLKFSKQVSPQVLILVPTRELVLQLVEEVERLTAYMSVRVTGVYGGTNISNQRRALAEGTDILVATPGRLYDLAVERSVNLKTVSKLVIDEVDVMLDLGFRFQLVNIFDLLRQKRQNIMFSATMTQEIDALIDDFFTVPVKISIAVSGTPLENISQCCYPVPNFHTKINLLTHLLKDRQVFNKVLVFVSVKKMADKVFEELEGRFGDELCIIHSNKSQNYRIRSIHQFEEGKNRILIATDVMARGLDLEKISHVINFDTPDYPETYMHRIGRTGRAKEQGNAILFFTEAETEARLAIEKLMNRSIQVLDLPESVELSTELLAEERPDRITEGSSNPTASIDNPGAAYHEKKEKNKKVNLGGSYRRKIEKKYKKPKTKGDKNYSKRKGK